MRELHRTALLHITKLKWVPAMSPATHNLVPIAWIVRVLSWQALMVKPLDTLNIFQRHTLSFDIFMVLK